MHIQPIVMVVYGFGEPYTITPNRRIVEEVVHLAWELNVNAICTDRDIAPLLEKHLPAGVMVFVIPPEDEQSSGRPTTWRLAVLGAKTLADMGGQELHVMYARPHLRALRDTQWALRDSGLNPKVRPHNVKITFDSKATTTYTRWWWLWYPLEMGMLIASWLKPGWYKRRSA